MLPYLDQAALYRSYRFDEPWDGPHNRNLHESVVSVYGCPSDPRAKRLTSYLAVVGRQAAWPGTRCLRIEDIVDGASNTILVVESTRPEVHWMEPRDLSFDELNVRINPPQDSPPGISSGHPDVANVLLADGAVRTLFQTVSSDVLRSLLTINGGETIPEF